MHRLRNSGPFILTLMLSAMLSPTAHAQSLPLQTETISLPINKTTNVTATQQVAAVEVPAEELPDAPGMQSSSDQTSTQKTTSQKTTGSISWHCTRRQREPRLKVLWSPWR